MNLNNAALVIQTRWRGSSVRHRMFFTLDNKSSTVLKRAQDLNTKLKEQRVELKVKAHLNILLALLFLSFWGGGKACSSYHLTIMGFWNLI